MPSFSLIYFTYIISVPDNVSPQLRLDICKAMAEHYEFVFWWRSTHNIRCMSQFMPSTFRARNCSIARALLYPNILFYFYLVKMAPRSYIQQAVPKYFYLIMKNVWATSNGSILPSHFLWSIFKVRSKTSHLRNHSMFALCLFFSFFHLFINTIVICRSISCSHLSPSIRK